MLPIAGMEAPPSVDGDPECSSRRERHVTVSGERDPTCAARESPLIYRRRQGGIKSYVRPWRRRLLAARSDVSPDIVSTTQGPRSARQGGFPGQRTAGLLRRASRGTA